MSATRCPMPAEAASGAEAGGGRMSATRCPMPAEAASAPRPGEAV